MKLCLFDNWRVGVVAGEAVYELASALPTLVEADPDKRIGLAIEACMNDPGLATAARSGLPRPLSELTLRAPVGRYSNIYCAQGNYYEGRREVSMRLNMFPKATSSALGSGGVVTLTDADAAIFHHEAELAAVVGRAAKAVPAENALEYVFGYTCFIDVSARAIGRGLDFRDKSPDSFGPLGPWIVSRDEVGDPQRLDVRLQVNDAIRQDYNTDDMEHSVADIVAWTSERITLYPGDVLTCGTNHQGLGPMQHGDNVSLEISGIGELTVTVRDPLGRRWPDRVDAGMGPAIRLMRAGSPPTPDQMFTLRQIDGEG